MDLTPEMKFRTEHIKSFIIAVLVIIIAILSYAYFIERRQLLEKTDAEMHPPVPGNFDGSLQKKIAGIVLQYGSNPNDDIDKFLLDAKGEQTWIHFPPHTAKQVLSIAKLKSVISITVAEKRGKKEKINNELQTITGSQHTIDIHNTPPPPPVQGIDVTVTGSNPQLTTGDNGKPNAFILSNKLIVLPPHAADNLFPLIDKANIITVKGYERSSESGEVNISGLNLVRPYSLSIDSINYLVR